MSSGVKQSVIQSTGAGQDLPPPSKDNVSQNEMEGSDPEAEARKRREVLARRPSYRKILNDLSSTEGQSSSINSQLKLDPDGSSGRDSGSSIHGSASANSYIKVIPASAIQLAGPANAGSPITGIPTIVQYTPSQDGQFFVPDLQTYQIRQNNPSSIAQSVVMSAPSSHHSGHHGDDSSKKRELRLLKNRLRRNVEGRRKNTSSASRIGLLFSRTRTRHSSTSSKV